eukprot:CAMPEP_0205814176 /NCGR_PEP_ID=MMETSP0205-20121125/19181_1 /ASSEMBLY_ACC=CAM_ASM_000278 /TAXON_ID=36767 /ORGANISM="Euplotes focardii, Strain TN1" /LENGTH=105 /DNA_ID=CAMNT_0053097695 /DNA_START=666 /DNA_END=979 /DNA_ORIENTATION=-
MKEDDQMYQFDKSMKQRKKSNAKIEFRKKIKAEEQDTREALIESMNDQISDKDKEKHVIDTLEQIGLFRQLSLEGNVKAMFQNKDLDIEESIADDKAIIDAIGDR